MSPIQSCTRFGGSTSLSVGDLEQIRQWNKTIPEGTVRCLHDLVIERANCQPDALAIDAWDGSFTYGELDQLSFHLSLLLFQQNVRLGTIVSLCFEKSKWTPVAMLGVLRAGGSFVLLDSALPMQRASAMKKLVESNILLTAANVKLDLSGLFSNAIYVNVDLFKSIFPARILAAGRVSKPTPQDLALVLFTSGSTGAPKAILQDHISASTTAVGLGSSWNIGPKSRILQFAAYAFDMSVIDTFMALVNGACLCIPTQEEFAANPGAVVTRMQANFSAVTASVASNYPAGIEKILRTLVLGGEKVPTALIETWSKKLIVYNGYGPAEGSVCSFARANQCRPTSIGAPLNTLAWVVDDTDHNKLIPIGEIGELLIEGPMLAKGYLKDSNKTQSSFIEDPEFLKLVFGSERDSPRRFYKTGDLVRQYPDGTMDYCGRKDLQIKVRGQRVELSEVEYHLQKSLPERWVAVVDVVEISSGPALMAFVRMDHVVQENRSNEESLKPLGELFPALEEDMISCLTSALPPYMIPSTFWLVPEIPMSLSGKTDRTALKNMGMDAHNRQVDQFISDTSIQNSDSVILKSLQQHWSTTLRLVSKGIAPDADFFTLGGNSLLAMRLASKLNIQYPSARISIRDIFSNRTLRLQSQLLKLRSTIKDMDNHHLEANSHEPNMQMIKDICEETGFLEHEVEDVLEATDSQTNMLWGEMTCDECEVHHCVLTFDPPIDTDRIRRAINSLMNQHSILRTCFIVHKGKVWQCVLKSIPSSALQIRNTSMNSTNKEGLASYEIGPFRKALYLARFNLKVNNGKTEEAVLRISHCMFDGGHDGGFMHRILVDLSALFQGKSVPESPAFAMRCTGRLVQLPAGVEYWRKAMQDAAPSRIVAKRGPQDMNLLQDEVVRTVYIPAMPTGITTATLVKAAWALTLSELLQTNDVVFANITSGRGLPVEDIDMILGPCISTIPIRVRISAAMTALQLLARVQDQYLDAMAYETVGLQTIAQECTNWPRWEDLSTVVNDLSEENFLDQLDETVDFGEGQMCKANVYQRPGKWVDIAVEVKKDCDTIHARLYFCSEVIQREIVEELDDMLVANITMLCSSGDEELRPARRGPVNRNTSFPLPPLNSSNSFTGENFGCERDYPAEETLVQEAWQTVLSATATDVAERPYFDKWPVACAYGLQKFFAERNYAVTVDDLIQNPSMKEQIFLLARNKRLEN